jgi:hypothetical protein
MKDYKHRIAAVFVFKNGMIAVFDQWGKQMPFFQGRRDFKRMKQIKDRIERQLPCGVEWQIEEGANFSGQSGVIVYANNRGVKST